MKILILALLLIPTILYSQEQGTEPPPAEDKNVEEFDLRCYSPLRWSASLISAKKNGTTHEEVVMRMYKDWHGGSLKNYQPETISYMLEIVAVVFETETIETNEEYFDVLRTVETLCISYIETETPKDKDTLST